MTEPCYITENSELCDHEDDEAVENLKSVFALTSENKLPFQEFHIQKKYQ